MNFDVTKFNVPNIEHPPLKLTNQNLASEFYNRLVEMINDFESDLNEQEEIGVRLVSFGKTVQFHIEDLGYYNPSLITFNGRLDNGSRVELIQHISQISFLLMALPKQNEVEPPNRIGFKLIEEQE